MRSGFGGFFGAVLIEAFLRRLPHRAWRAGLRSACGGSCDGACGESARFWPRNRVLARAFLRSFRWRSGHLGFSCLPDFLCLPPVAKTQRIVSACARTRFRGQKRAVCPHGRARKAPRFRKRPSRSAAVGRRGSEGRARKARVRIPRRFVRLNSAAGRIPDPPSSAAPNDRQALR